VEGSRMNRSAPANVGWQRYDVLVGVLSVAMDVALLAYSLIYARMIPSVTDWIITGLVCVLGYGIARSMYLFMRLRAAFSFFIIVSIVFVAAHPPFFTDSLFMAIYMPRLIYELAILIYCVIRLRSK
jgi:hypothetical protein